MAVRQTNLDFLGITGYKLWIHRLPTTSFTVQSIALPTISLPAVQQPTPLSNIKKAGDHLTYEDLRVRFLVDQQLANYLEIFNWMIDLGTPDWPGQYSEMTFEPGTREASDVTLFILDAKKNPIFNVVFNSAVPISLSGLTFDSTVGAQAYQSADMTLAYRSFRVNPIE